MKFSCKTSDLLQGLHLVSRAISNQQALPVLSNVLIEAEGKRCILTATDLELSIITSLEADIENEGSITTPAKALLNFAQYNTDDEVLLETSEGTQLKLTSEHAKTLITGEAASEYPSIASVKKEATFTLDAEPLLTALHMVTFASAKSSLRPVLSGVYLHAERGGLVLVATDSYRLSEYKMAASLSGSDVSCIIPAKVLEELKGILSRRPARGQGDEESVGDEKEKTPVVPSVGVNLSSQQIELKVGNTRLLSRLIDGKFPDYQQILPKDTKTTVLIDAKGLQAAVRRMHYFAKEINNNLTFTFRKNAVHITSPLTQLGKDEATLSAEVAGSSNKIALSSSYLLDFLAHAGEEKVEIRLTDSMHPALFGLPETQHFLHLIMPLRIQDDGEAAEVQKEVKTAA